QIVAFPAIQLSSSASATTAFKNANPGRDLVYVVGRANSSSNYRIYALNAANGSEVWHSADISGTTAVGGMLVDYTRDRLYVPTTASSNSLRIYNTLNGALITTANTKAVSTGVVRDAFWNNNQGQAIVVADDGTAYGIPLGWTSAPSIAWTGSVGAAPTSFPLP